MFVFSFLYSSVNLSHYVNELSASSLVALAASFPKRAANVATFLFPPNIFLTFFIFFVLVTGPLSQKQLTGTDVYNLLSSTLLTSKFSMFCQFSYNNLVTF